MRPNLRAKSAAKKYGTLSNYFYCLPIVLHSQAREINENCYKKSNFMDMVVKVCGVDKGEAEYYSHETMNGNGSNRNALKKK